MHTQTIVCSRSVGRSFTELAKSEFIKTFDTTVTSDQVIRDIRLALYDEARSKGRAEVYVMVECSYFAVDSMPIEMYGESWITGLLTSDDVIPYMAGFGTM